VWQLFLRTTSGIVTSEQLATGTHRRVSQVASREPTCRTNIHAGMNRVTANPDSHTNVGDVSTLRAGAMHQTCGNTRETGYLWTRTLHAAPKTSSGACSNHHTPAILPCSSYAWVEDTTTTTTTLSLLAIESSTRRYDSRSHWA